MAVQQLHHVAYRCNDAKQTADFYIDILGLKYYAAVSEDTVPSTGEKCPYMHIFFAMADGSCVAFFEVPEAPPAIKDTNTPEWVQHLALVVEDEEELLEKKAKLEAAGVDVIGPTNHGFCQSIYFFDPNGHRLELTVRTETPEMMERLSSSSEEMLEEWTKTKTVQKQAAWVHGAGAAE
ncbi:MAG: glyoxalase [Rhodospirillaceae bacterium]|mgnify:FL=1|nr:glyoxalase [Rhodospirillaceae bacterium]MDG2033575.1 VOC family protein [Rhodospirillales bacterium]